MTDCPFCRIVTRVEERELACEWHDAVAFEPLDPVAPGHLLVVPRLHVVDALDRPDVTARVFGHAAQIARRPCNLITSVGPAASQSVMHLHVHIVPRRRDDGLHLPWTVPADVDRFPFTLPSVPETAEPP